MNAAVAMSDPRLPDLQSFIDMMDDGLLLCDPHGVVLQANAAVRSLLLVGDAGPECLIDLLPDQARVALGAGDAWEGDLALPDERILRAHIHRPPAVAPAGRLLVFRDISDVRARERELERWHAELRQTTVRLAGTQEQLLQSEKLASIGQLAAGVAHEINNPIGYVHSNLGSLQEYLNSLFAMIDAYDHALRSADPRVHLEEIDALREQHDIDFISRDLPQLLAESRQGIERVTRIVRDLKDFSYYGRGDAWKRADLHAGLDSTLNIIWNELKYKAKLEKHYGKLPLVECLPSEINQVFMNMLLNAGHAIGEQGTITLSTGAGDGEAWVEIADTGNGIAPELLQKIFDPFFTTKPVGKGTGLGLSISYGIVNKHHGRIEVDSVVGQGTTFRVTLPVKQPEAAGA